MILDQGKLKDGKIIFMMLGNNEDNFMIVQLTATDFMWRHTIDDYM